MEGLLALLVFEVSFFLMMRFGWSAHMVHGHGHGGEKRGVGGAGQRYWQRSRGHS